jgi:hypothetical protein
VYKRTLRIILKSDLNAKNKITGIGGFGVINWRLEERDHKARKILTIYTANHQS